MTTVGTVEQLGNFSGQADAYARARPGYPPAMVERLIATAKLEPGATIAELGAGTGLLTSALSGRGFEILALEPGEAMRARAPALPDVRWLDGRFEDCPLAGASVDWIVAAQAFHWADPGPALAEMHRVLRPGRALSVVWNDRDLRASALLRETRALIEARVPGFDEGYRHRDWAAVLVSTGHFGAVEATELGHVVAMSHARFRQLWRSHNKLNYAVRELGGIEPFLAALEPVLAAYPDPVEVPYRCRAWTVWRREPSA